jgi:hypothetical protein
MPAETLPVSSLVRRPDLLEVVSNGVFEPALVHPSPGDIVLCEAIDTGGPYPGIEIAPDARMRPIGVADRFAAVLGRRESALNPSGIVPSQALRQGDRLHLLSVAGLVGIADYAPRSLGQKARLLAFRGAFRGREGVLLNLRDWPCLADADAEVVDATTWTVVCGSSAEVGKTTLVERLLKAAAVRERRVGAVKLTGTGRAKDRQRFLEAGAAWAGDFVDTGLETTYGVPAILLERMLSRLATEGRRHGVSALFCEFGGDLLEAGVPLLLPMLRNKASFLFLANDAMSARMALDLLTPQADVSIVVRSANLRAFERRLDLPRVYDVDIPADITDLLHQALRRVPPRPAWPEAGREREEDRQRP